MTFKTLSELLAKQPSATIELTEARDHMADLDGIKSIVDDALADLNDKLIGKDGSVLALLKSTGAGKLDTVKDADGKNIQAQLKDKVVSFKKEVEKLMTEVEILLSQVGGQVDEALLEGNMAYGDSAEFTEEFYAVHKKLVEIKQSMTQPRWMGWMKATDHNYNTQCVALSSQAKTQLQDLEKTFDELEHELVEKAQ